jgi:excisionase family DNA binding protein
MDKPADPATPFAEVYQAFFDDLVAHSTFGRPETVPNHLLVMTSETFYSTQEAGALIGLSRHTIARYCASGRIKAIAINTGRRPIYRIRERDLLAFVREWVRDE